MRTIIALLLGSCVLSLAQTNPDKNAPLNANEKLLNAAQSGDMETVKLLLEKGADVNAKGNVDKNIILFDATALRYAAEKGHTDVVKLLLDKGAEINAKDNLGATALMWAVMSGHTDTVKLLLDRGADVNAKDDEGATALMGFISPDFDISTGLPKPLTTDEEIDEMTIHTLLLDKGADIKAKDNKYGETALTHMAESGFTNMVTLLLDRGADITAKNYNGETALSRAADTGETNAVKLLLARGADINAVDTNGETALGKAKRQGNVAIVQLLQKAGATALSASDSFFNVAVASGTNTDSSGYVTNAALLTPFTLTNSAGDVITNAVLVKLMPNKFIYKTPTGVMGTRRLDSLSTELQNRFGYDAASAAAQDSIEAEAKMRAMQWQQSQRNLAQQQAELKAQSQSAVSDISRSIRAKAEKEWPGDYEMQRYEINKQTDAYNWLVIASSATGVPQQVFDQIKIKAASEWADDYEMQKYEITKQVKAYVELH